MARDAEKQVQPYLSPREKKKPIEKQPQRLSVNYSERFTGSSRAKRVDIDDVVNRLYKVDPNRKKVSKTTTQMNKTTAPTPVHNRYNKTDSVSPYNHSGFRSKCRQ